MEKIRLNRALKDLCSRRVAEQLIEQGRVTVDGVAIVKPQAQIAASSRVAVDGKELPQMQKVYFLLNKPAGYICSAREGGARRVLDLFRGCPQRLFTVGRLDCDTSGLLLVTNDGDFAHKVAHPSFNIPKEYLVKTAQEITDEHLKLLSRGTIVQGTIVIPHSVKKVRKGTVKIIVGEGKKHEVRLLVASAGLTLLDLRRIRIGPFLLGTLEPGEYRKLSDKEVANILDMM